MKTYQHKLGTSRAGARTRVWLEGKRLIAAGFTHGQRFARDWRDGKLIISVVDEATWDAQPRSERGTVAGSPDRPIIDIASLQVAETFKGTHVAVTYGSERITVREA